MAACHWSRFVRAIWIVLLPLLAVMGLHAAEQSYDYDALGRLVRSTSGGESVEYRYDPAGNLLEVTGAQPVVAPVIAGVMPDSLRRGQSATITLDGSGLAYASVSSPSPELAISGVKAQPDSLSFTLAVAEDAALGAHAFTLVTAAGSVNFDVGILPKLPVMSVAPLPLAVAPDGVPRSFTLTLANADTIAHTLNLSTGNPAIASVNPATLTIPPGQTGAIASVTGLAAGSTSLALTSSTLQTVVVPVFVTTEFAGINTSHAPLLGVVLEKPPAPPASQTIQLGARAVVGVVVGGFLRDIAPQAVSQGASMTLTLLGKGLESATAASLVPADGVALGSLTAAADGYSATLPITVASDAPATLRQIVLSDGMGKRFPASRTDSDRLLIAFPAPVVESITPLFGTVGAPVGITLRGRNLQRGKLQLSPGTGIQVDNAAVVNADGTAMTFKLGIGSLTALGEHGVAVSTPGGTSSNVKGPANTFTVVTALNETLAPIVSPLVGVLLQAEAPPTSQSVALGAPMLGVARGPIVTAMTPRAGIVGETVTLTLQGKELGGMTALTFIPSDGLAMLAAPSVGAESASVAVQIDVDAPKVARTVKVWAGTGEIPFADVRQSRLLVTAPMPRIDSVTPINLATGSGPTTLTLRGAHFKDVSLVTASPASGLTIGQSPAVNADHTEIMVNVTVEASAPTGQRVLAVTTPAGTSDGLSTPANTIHIVSALGEVVTPIQAPALGVVKASDDPPPTINALLPAPDVGVLLESVPVPATQAVFLGNAFLGVALGPVAKTMQATDLRPGIAGTLTITGVGLDAVDALGVSPSAGIVLGEPVIQPDGLAMSVPISLAADVVAGAKSLILKSGASPVPFADAADARFIVATGEPRIDSITPILARQGETVMLTLRGAHLGRGKVLIEPASGVVPGAAPAINAEGTELTLGIHVPADAALGGRVIRVRTPGGTTTDQAAPANTFTVFPP